MGFFKGLLNYLLSPPDIKTRSGRGKSYTKAAGKRTKHRDTLEGRGLPYGYSRNSPDFRLHSRMKKGGRSSG